MDLEHRAVQVTAVADIVALTTTAVGDLLMKLGYNHNSLFHAKHRLCAVNYNSLPKKGALIATISLGDEIWSRTIYICPKVKGLYISR